MRRRDFIAGFGTAVAVVSRSAVAQQRTLPVIGFVNFGMGDDSSRSMVGFRKGLSDSGYVESHNVTVEQHWLGSEYDRLPAVMADFVRRRLAVIVTPGSALAAIAAKAATATIPIVFAVAQDPVKLGLAASLARPGGNATGVNFFQRGGERQAAGTPA